MATECEGMGLVGGGGGRAARRVVVFMATRRGSRLDGFSVIGSSVSRCEIVCCLRINVCFSIFFLLQLLDIDVKIEDCVVLFVFP